MKRNLVFVMVVCSIILGNLWMAKVVTPALQIPDTIVEKTTDSIPSTVNTTKNSTPVEQGRVVAVIDGDTIDVEIQNTIKRVRYIGIDTPEMYQDNGQVECFAKEASIKNEVLVLGKIVRLEKDTSEIDRYGRLLRYVYVGENLINTQLVAEGYAYAVTFPPDIAKAEEFKVAEVAARSSGVGLWSLCNK